ncbi:MAG TPA: DUF4190 domain-containing protein [Micromonosporaceae bacterium]
MTQPYPVDRPGPPPDPSAPGHDRWPHQRQPGDPSPPGYPTQPAYPALPGYPPPVPEPGLNGFAVASLVLGIIGGILLSVIFGIVALVQMRKRPYRGKGLAIAGLVLSGVWTLGLIALIVVAIAAGADRDASGQVTGAGSVSARQLRPGDCVNDLDEGENVLSLPAVPCAESHEGEVFATFRIPGTTWPGDTQVSRQAEQGCWDRLSSYAPAADEESVELFLLQPTQEAWTRGDHGVTCIATHHAGRTTGSLRD